MDKPQSSSRVSLRSRAAQIQAAIEIEIVKGVLRPGERLDESRLAQRFEVSRTPVREALKALASSGLVVMRPHSGAIVANPSVGQIMEMFEVMAELEAFAARLAATRRTEENRTQLVETHQDCVRIGSAKDPDTFFEANRHFHEAIYQAAHNSVLLGQIHSLDKRLTPYRRLITFRPGRVEESLEEHSAILEAIAVGDAVRAGDAVRRHLALLGEDALTLARATEAVAGGLPQSG